MALATLFSHAAASEVNEQAEVAELCNDSKVKLRQQQATLVPLERQYTVLLYC